MNECWINTLPLSPSPPPTDCNLHPCISKELFLENKARIFFSISTPEEQLINTSTYKSSPTMGLLLGSREKLSLLLSFLVPLKHVKEFQIRLSEGAEGKSLKTWLSSWISQWKKKKKQDTEKAAASLSHQLLTGRWWARRPTLVTQLTSQTLPEISAEELFSKIMDSKKNLLKK